MRRLRFMVLALVLTVTICSVFVHPFGKVKTGAAKKMLLQGTQVETPVMNTLERSCSNCHSDQTFWPWYSYVAPASWLVEKDVHDGREHFNMSLWNEYTDRDRIRILTEISVMVRNHEMPLPRYTLLHPDAKLTAQDIEAIDQWGHTERKRIKAGASQQSPGIAGEARIIQKQSEHP